MADDKSSAEDRLIARHFKPLATHPGALGLFDDAAFIKPPAGCDLVLQADALVGGVHFFPDDPAHLIAAKALRTNLSDLAAKGAAPLGFLLSLALPKALGDDWLGDFAKGLRGDIEAYGCPLFGGDTTRTPGPAMISVSMFGSVPEGTMVRREGAKAGDLVFVTATIGDAALGLFVRNGEAQWPLDAALIPHSDAAKAVIAADPAARETALTGGDDYEILCTVPPAKADNFRAAAQAANVPVTRIGVIAAGEGVRFLDAQGRPLAFRQASFSHF